VIEGLNWSLLVLVDVLARLLCLNDTVIGNAKHVMKMPQVGGSASTLSVTQEAYHAIPREKIKTNRNNPFSQLTGMDGKVLQTVELKVCKGNQSFRSHRSIIGSPIEWRDISEWCYS
jgi:hypothetical protein